MTSGFTLTVAHHALQAGHRGALKLWLFLTIVLGFTFLGFQAYEYIHAYHALNLKLTDRRLRLDVLHADGLPRLARDDRRDHAVGDAGPRAQGAISTASTTSRSRRAAWYWHFVDVVWLLLFVLVYWLCTGALRCARPAGSAQAGRRDPAQVVGQHEEGDQRRRQRDAQRQRLDHARAVAVIAVEIVERREEARDDRHEPGDDDDLHSARSTRRV